MNQTAKRLAQSGYVALLDCDVIWWFIQFPQSLLKCLCLTKMGCSTGIGKLLVKVVNNGCRESIPELLDAS